jgi:hypothetical protein
MKTLGGLNCRGMHVLRFKVFDSVGDHVEHYWIWVGDDGMLGMINL